MSPRRRSLPSELSNIAFRIFDHIRSPVAVVANMRGKSGRGIAFTGSLLIRYLIQRRVPEDALSVYREMQRQSVDITLPLKLWLVRALVQGHAVEPANVLFSEISASIPSAHENSLFLATALHLFSSQGDATRSEAAFKALEDRNMVNYRSIGLRLLAHARNGDVDTVLRYFHHHFPRNTEAGDRPDIFHYTAILMAHAKACDSAGLNEWLGNMIADGVKPDRHVYNILLEDCAQRGRFEDVASIIKEMRIRGLPPLAEAYTTVITALAKRGDPVTAEAFYKKALREGVKPDRQMIASLMTAHSEVSSWKGVIRVFDYLTSSDDRHLRPRIDIYNILLNAYVLAGSPFEIVSDVFQKMEQSGIRPTVHTFSILIKSACDSGKMDIAMRVFVELDSLAESWKTGFTMNVYALTILMAGYLRQGDQSKAKEIYDEMLFRGIAPTSVTYNSILRAYISEGSQESIQLACDFMKSLMESPDQPPKWLSTYSRFSGFENIYSPLMTLFARNAKAEQVEELMDDMVKAGGERTLATLTLLLNAYRNAGDVDECRRVWDEIFPAALRFLQYGQLLGNSDPDTAPRRDLQHRANIICVPLSIHMDALSAAGAHAEVAELWKTVRAHGFALDSHNWNHLIVVLVRAGEIERAFEILERIIIPCLQRPPGTMDAATTTNTTTTSPTTNVTAIREAAPRTPLSYDDGPPPQDPSALAMEATRSRRTYLSDVARASGVQLAKEHVGTGLATHDLSSTDSSAGERPDFAHPLRILQQILPSWNTWQPHAAVVILLMDVLGQLEAGHMIEPIPPRRFADAVGSSTWQGEESEASAASSLLRRIHASCPQAVTIVREYHYRIRVRRELARMVDEG
jgi:pentatricopeptide repeat-containing protein PET309